MFTLHYDAYQTFEEADHDVCFVDRCAASVQARVGFAAQYTAVMF